MTDSCANCRFWKGDPWSREKVGSFEEGFDYAGDPKSGQCRRYPPFIGEWQTTEADIWCGEHDLSRALPSQDETQT